MSGPLPKFSAPHLWMALDLIKKHKRIGRRQLAKMMNIGEGSARTILEKLSRLGLVKSIRGGSFLSEEGRKLTSKLPKILEADLQYLSLGKKSMIALVPNGAARVSSGIEQRDAAISVGGKGATILVFRAGKLKFPDGIDVEKDVENVLTIVNPIDGDAVVIGFGDNKISAELATRAAVLSLLPKISQFFVKLCSVP